MNIKKHLNSDDFITRLATKARFTKGDVKVILDAMIELFEEFVREEITVKIRSFGKLYIKSIPPRKVSGYTDKFGVYHNPKELPETRKVIFSLSENIRYSGQEKENFKTLDKDENM